MPNMPHISYYIYVTYTIYLIQHLCLVLGNVGLRDWRVTLLWRLVSFKIYCSISRLCLCLPKDMIDVRHGLVKEEGRERGEYGKRLRQRQAVRCINRETQTKVEVGGKL